MSDAAPVALGDLTQTAVALVPAAAGGGVLGIAGPARREVWAFGFTAAGRAAQGSDRFGVSSVTKGITAVQTLMAGVPLNTPIAALIPEFVQPEVTALHVLSHSSGLAEAANSAEDPARASLSAAEHLEIALSAGLDFTPGSEFRYSSPGFWLLAEAIRRLTGMSHVEHLAREVAGPLGLGAFGYSAERTPPNYVQARTGRTRGLHQEDTRRCAYPAGGVSATASDLLSFALALPRLVDVELLARPRSEGSWLGHRVRWATGWELGGPGALIPANALYCSGGSGCSLWFDPRTGVAACVLTAGWALPREVIGQLGDLLWQRAAEVTA